MSYRVHVEIVALRLQYCQSRKRYFENYSPVKKGNGRAIKRLNLSNFCRQNES